MLQVATLAGPPHVLLACCGLDHARRGFESFARECFDQLHDDQGVKIELVKGSGTGGTDVSVIPTLRRDRRVARTLGQLIGFRPFRLESLAFAVSLQPLITRRRPDVVYTSEWDTARGLAWVRSVSRQRFKLLLCNGGFAERGFGHLDHVQQLTPAARDHVLRLGADPARHTVLPLGFTIPFALSVPSDADRAALRAKWQLPADDWIVISVAALNRSHKRLDYMIDELAAVPGPQPFALLVGEPDAETPALRSYAARRLEPGRHRFLTVASDQVSELLLASDVFVLASVAEMQGRAVVEAMSRGLTCIVHDSPVLRFAVGEHALVGNLEQPGSLTRLLARARSDRPDPIKAEERHRYVYERFGWERLKPAYIRLLEAVARGDTANRTVSSSNGEKLSK